MVGQRQLDGAREMAALARSTQPEEDVYAAAAVALAEASLAAAEGDRDAVLARFRKALALLEEQQLQVDLGEARIAFACALRDLGQFDGARAEFARARAIFTTMDAVGMIARIDAELAAMERGPATPAPFVSVVNDS
jgi:tetratricopeptide (TPR) repeat protein